MNLKIILLLVSLVFICASGTDKKNSLKEQNLKGNVKTLKEFWYDPIIESGKITKTNEKANQSFISLFDNNGNQIELKYYSQGNLYYEITFKYDSLSNLIEDYKYNERGELKEKNIYKNDAKGNKIEKNNFKVKVIYNYDDMGNMIEESTYSSSGNLRKKYIYKYDDKGNKIEGILYDSKGNLESKFTYKYDKDNNVIEGKEYDMNNNIIEPIYRFKYEFENNEKGNWIKKIMFSNGSQNYSEMGHLIDDSNDSSSDNLIYNPVLIVEREIEYY